MPFMHLCRQRIDVWMHAWLAILVTFHSGQTYKLFRLDEVRINNQKQTVDYYISYRRGESTELANVNLRLLPWHS
jgi:hypothetical protein